MANDTTNNADIISNLESTGWHATCIGLLPNVSNITSGFVDQYGLPVPTFGEDVWGVSVRLCEQYCNSDSIPSTFDFNSFATGVTNYFLPWLGLISQLPAGTGKNYKNVLALALALGSPALSTYSLSLTILSRYWERRSFQRLRFEIGRTNNVRQRYRIIDERINAIQFFLEQAQQVPLRISEDGGWFSSLIVLARNHDWWVDLATKLKDTQTTSDYALVASMIVAIVAWVLTVLEAFVADLGDTGTALQLSAGSIWIWLIPVVVGWITVGTQAGSHSIDAALRTELAAQAFINPRHNSHKLENDKTPEKSPVNEKDEKQDMRIMAASPTRSEAKTLLKDRSGLSKDNQEGFIVLDEGNGLSPQPNSTGVSGALVPYSHFMNVRGDEGERGPIYNFARIFTWTHLTKNVVDALIATVIRIRNEESLQEHLPEHVEEQHRGNPDPWMRFLEGSCAHTERYCGLDNNPIYAYPEWQQVPLEMWKAIAVASFWAIFVQWGTTGAAFIIAYLTPVRGISCRTGSYLIYGVLGTLAWWSLAGSALLSHAWLLGYQRQHQKTGVFSEQFGDVTDRLPPGATGGTDVENNPASAAADGPNTNRGSRDAPAPAANALESTYFRTIRITAAVLRYFGKIVAALNALWLLSSNLMEYAGAFDSCWCASDQVQLGPDAWILLFKSASDLKATALTPWTMGVAVSIIVCVVSYMFFYFGASDRPGGED